MEVFIRMIRLILGIKKLKWYACQRDIAILYQHIILYHYPAENVYLLFAGDSSRSPGYSHNKMAAVIFMYIAWALIRVETMYLKAEAVYPTYYNGYVSNSNLF